MSEFQPSLWHFFIEITETDKAASQKLPLPVSCGVNLRRIGIKKNIENALIPVSMFGLLKPISSEKSFFSKLFWIT